MRLLNVSNKLKLGIKCLYFSSIPLFTISFILNQFIDYYKKDLRSNIINNRSEYQYDNLIYYLSIGGLHIILSIVFIVYLYKEFWPKTDELRKQYTFVLFAVCFFNVLFVILSTWIFDPIIGVYSHERLYDILSITPNLEVYFKEGSLFYSFSIFPVVLTVCGLLVQVFVCFGIGNIIENFSRKKYKSKQIEEFKNESKHVFLKLKEYISIASIIMVTSTVATVLFLLLPSASFTDDNIKNSFTGTSFAICVSWGLIFSLTLFFIGIWAFLKWKKTVSIFKKKEIVKGNEDFVLWELENSDLFSLTSNIKLATSIFSPFLISIIGALIESF